MQLSVNAGFAFHLDQPTDLVLQFEVANTACQRAHGSSVELSGLSEPERIDALDGIGERLWASGEGRIEVRYRCTVEIDRNDHSLRDLTSVSAPDMTGEAAQSLFESVYCPVDRFRSFVESEFAGSEGGTRISAISEWISKHFTYDPGASSSATTALESFAERRGVCRDYAHVLIAMARASGIPARYVACFAPRVTPQDFHAVAQVFLKPPEDDAHGSWFLIDPTGMASAPEIAIIGVGRDAADVSFLTTFGPCTFIISSVSVERDE